MSLGFSFTLTATQEAIITVNARTTNPGGFYLEQSHPVDANNSTAPLNLFLNGGVSIQDLSGGPSVPEPGYWPILGIALALIAGIKLRRKVLLH